MNVARQRISLGGDQVTMTGRMTTVRPPGGWEWMVIRLPSSGTPITRLMCGFQSG
jgi:hypothetical protein